jgi:hypothetical protein
MPSLILLVLNVPRMHHLAFSFEKNLGENQPLCCPLYLALATLHTPVQTIRVITKLPNSKQSYKGKVKTHKYINRSNQSTTGKL